MNSPLLPIHITAGGLALAAVHGPALLHRQSHGAENPFTTAPMRALPILLIFVTMFYWVWRVRRRGPLPVVVRHDSMPVPIPVE